MFGYAEISLSRIDPVVLISFQEAMEQAWGVEPLLRLMQSCLAKEKYVEIAFDYVGSDIFKPIQILIFASTKTIEEKRVQITRWGQEKTLKEQQVC